MIPVIMFPVALVAMFLTYTAAYHTMKMFRLCNSPLLATVCVALLSGLSLLTFGNAVVILVLLPCAALGLALSLLFLLKWLNLTEAWRRLQELMQDETGTLARRRHHRAASPVSRQNQASGQLRESPPEEE